MSMKKLGAFTTKQVRQKRNSDFSFARDESEAVRGFTLVETMVAVSILAIAVVGPMFAASRAIVAAKSSEYQLTASYLAQEGVEYVRAMRDKEYLAAYQAGGNNISANAWNNFLNGSMPTNPGAITQCRSPKICTLDPVLRSMGYGGGFALDAFSGAMPLYLVGGVYTQQILAGSTKTPFTRTLQIEAVAGAPVDTLGNPVDVRVVSNVSWDFHGVPYSVTITDHLTPWQ